MIKYLLIQSYLFGEERLFLSQDEQCEVMEQT